MSRERELLESAVAYALTGAALVTPRLLAHPTPCAGWDLAMMLDHVGDSIATLHEALATERVGAASGRRRDDRVARLRAQTADLLGACATCGPPERVVAVGDRELTARMVAVVAAMEIAVHGWDIAVACGAGRPVPAGLAAVLLALAPLFVTAETRPGLFADPVRCSGRAHPGDQLVAFLGRQPRRFGS